ncbi:16S rRNA (uracil1498-N3)-methyltransferase [Monaibacterium marinum]|uniref:Ribosomal RNA small subunit methyltransferase E n=1 Tax=Pontivivens marinum TaxID=1690039 RepID=A0A2C9CMF1_9RHOB|nr:16S rRNA (uracil(1498)-N(3))-methyltransferase [Monaibacterium marinum]SOH92701.1 16S rRNA (uracil1498-N3)-methyltransferase [Monaibacterium marinum]
MEQAKIRLFVEDDLAEGAVLNLAAQAHYLTNVMRLQAGALVALFNGRDGEWTARLVEAGKRRVTAECLGQAVGQGMPPDLWLLFAPIKKARTDFIVEKATEMGARRIQPVFTRFTNSERVRPDKLRAHCIEAAEQCGGVYVPELLAPTPLDKLLDTWPADRRLMFCDETADGMDAMGALTAAGGDKWAIIIGPEGGFATEEAERLRALSQSVPVSLGPRILRADTAAVAAMALWQVACGDWRV